LSIDVHPSGSRFVTTGFDHKSKIWNMLPVLDAEQEANRMAPRLLATLAEHFAPVNVARFSRCGRLLASGSDDHKTCLYELRPGPGQAMFGSNDGPNIENWKHFSTLRGHSNNVVDLAWSRDDKLLATASLDNKVIIWNPATGQQVTTLEKHESYVKGVSWDPMGEPCASAHLFRALPATHSHCHACCLESSRYAGM
jgi:protein HIRA/HIR1